MIQLFSKNQPSTSFCFWLIVALLVFIPWLWGFHIFFFCTILKWRRISNLFQYLDITCNITTFILTKTKITLVKRFMIFGLECLFYQQKSLKLRSKLKILIQTKHEIADKTILHLKYIVIYYQLNTISFRHENTKKLIMFIRR